MNDTDSQGLLNVFIHGLGFGRRQRIEITSRRRHAGQKVYGTVIGGGVIGVVEAGKWLGTC